MVLFASKEDHCLADLLYRWRAGELECEVPCVISNHEDLRGLVEWHGIRSCCVPVGSEPAAKEAAFEEMERIVEHERADVIVLARYMQILPASFCATASGPHHQHPPLLPAVVRRRPPLPPGLRRGA